MGTIRAAALAAQDLMPELARFLGAGGLATATHYAVLGALTAGGLLPAVAATCLGYAVGAALNYWLRRRLVFRSRRPHRRALPRYLAVVAAGLGVNAGVVALGTAILALPLVPVQLAATGLVPAWNFVAHRAWTFAGA